MIHIQNWRIFASHYNDDASELVLELKKAQQDYKMYGQQLGVSITEELVVKAKRPSVGNQFPYFFHGTDVEDYKQAQFIEQNNNCIAINEWLTSKGVSKQSTGRKPDVPTRDEEKITDMEVFTEFEFGGDDMFNINNDHSSKPIAEKLKDFNKNMTSDEMPVKEFSKNMTSDETLVKKKQLFEYYTPAKNDHEQIRFKDTGLFLSSTTKQLMQSIEKASNSVQVVYN
jgi:hypothetical protein